MSSKVMKQFFTRLSDKNNIYQSIFIDIHSDVIAFAVMEKPETNRHYHSYFEGVLTESAYRKRFEKQGFKNGRGNSVQTYMVKQPDQMEKHHDQTWNDRKDTLLRYLCKGESKDSMPNVILNTLGLTDEQIKDYHDRYWELRETYTGNTEVKEKKKTFMEVVEEKWNHSNLKQQLLGERVDDWWDTSKLCFRVHAWLMSEFKILSKLQDTPTVKRYVIHLMLDIVSVDMMMKAQWKGDMTSYF